MQKTEPTPSDPQRLRALEQANVIRLARAELKRQIGEGELSVSEIILQCPEAARRWTIAELLVSQRRWGTTRCRKFLERNHIGEMKPVGELTERQRRVLAAQLGRPGAEAVELTVLDGGITPPRAGLTRGVAAPRRGDGGVVAPPRRQLAFA